MDVENLKYVVGRAEQGQPAIIRFFTAVDERSVQSFNDEFLWLQDYVKPSKIIVMINSEGGSVLYGMSRREKSSFHSLFCTEKCSISVSLTVHNCFNFFFCQAETLCVNCGKLRAKRFYGLFYRWVCIFNFAIEWIVK